MKREIITVFDFDGTVTRKDTLLEFIKFSKGRIRLYFGLLLFSPLLVAMRIKIYPNGKSKQRFFSYFYRGVPVEKFNHWCKEFSAEIDKMIRPQAIEAIKSHKENGNKIFIISASIENWILPWAEKTGIETVIATKIETDKNGLLTGKFLTKNCYGQEKVNRLLKKFPNRKDYKLIVYGDSRGDKELLKFADEAYFQIFYSYLCRSL